MATLIRGDGRTVNAYQDSIMGDFAFSGKDGIIKDVGQACGLDTTTLNSVKIKSGMVVIQGRQISLDGTDTITLPVATGSTVYWTTLYLELDLSAIADDELTGKVTLKKLEYTSSYPAVPTSDNLKIQTAGKAYIGLYRFKNTANGVNSVEQIAETIDSGDLTKETEERFEDIETRLDRLGFRQGSVQLRYSGASVSVNELKRQGNYVFGQISATTGDTDCIAWASTGFSGAGYTSFIRNVEIGTIPKNFRPKTNITLGAYILTNISFRTAQPSSYSFKTQYSVVVTSSGKILLNAQIDSRYAGITGVLEILVKGINFGFEAEPIIGE